MKKRVLFVCLGNICRSPAAEGIFRQMIRDKNLQEHLIHDSAGTGGWHVGAPPDARMIIHAKNRKYDLSDLRARKFDGNKDFENFDLILTMDDSNYQDVLDSTQNPQHRSKVQKMTSYCHIHSLHEVPDPYYREEDGFEHVLDILEDACAQLILKLETEVKMERT